MGQLLMEPYSVKKGEEETNWWAELTTLQTLKNKGESNWTEDERKYYEKLFGQAMSWVTCACGNQCSIIPRTSEGAPYDPVLRDLGGDFPGYIHRLDIEKATETLEKIEIRSEKLIKGMLVKKLKKE